MSPHSRTRTQECMMRWNRSDKKVEDDIKSIDRTFTWDMAPMVHGRVWQNTMHRSWKPWVVTLTPCFFCIRDTVLHAILVTVGQSFDYPKPSPSPSASPDHVPDLNSNHITWCIRHSIHVLYNALSNRCLTCSGSRYHEVTLQNADQAVWFYLPRFLPRCARAS